MNLIIPDLVDEFVKKAQVHSANLSSMNSETVTKLKQVYQARNQNKLQPGELVVINPLLQNDLYPIGNQPGIVLEVLDKPITEPTNGHLMVNVFFDALDVKVGFVTESMIHTILLPSWRLMKYEETAI